MSRAVLREALREALKEAVVTVAREGVLALVEVIKDGAKQRQNLAIRRAGGCCTCCRCRHDDDDDDDDD